MTMLRTKEYKELSTTQPVA